MKVVHLSTYRDHGGAARAAYRIHQSLLKTKFESVFISFSEEPEVADKSHKVIFSNTLKIKKILNSIRNRIITYPYNITYSINPIKGNLTDKINSLQADIVHIHWVNGGILALDDLKKINAKIVFTIHDSWIFTGGCHVPQTCVGFVSGCKQCEISILTKFLKTSERGFRKKQKFFSENKVTVVGPSRWICNSSKSSKVLINTDVFNIPNPINTQIFKPENKIELRKKYNLPTDKKIILFGAMGPESDKNKGYQYLKELLQILEYDNNVCTLIFGMTGESIFNKLYYLGKINSDNDLSEVFNLADVSVVPSLSENFSNTILESMSCGTPVVAFNIGGNPDLINHKINGYLATPYLINDLHIGINWVLDNSQTLSYKSRKKVEEEFEFSKVGKLYMSLYNDILNIE